MKSTGIRRAFALALSMMLVGVGAAACGSSSGSSNSSSGPLSGVLSVGWNSSELAGIKAAIAKFEQLHPKVRISLSSADTDAYQASLRTELSAGTAPDVFYAWPGNGNPGAIQVLAPGGFLANESNQPWVSTIPTALRNYTKVNGKTYLIPMSFSGTGMLFNAETLRQTGLQVPNTYSEVLTFCKDVQQQGKIAFDLGIGDSIFGIVLPYELAATLVAGLEPNFVGQQSKGEATFESSKGYQQVFAKMVQMNKVGCFGPKPLGTGFAQTVADISNGKAVGTLGITPLLAQYFTADPKATWVMVPLPATNNPDQTMMSGGTGAGPALNSHAKHLALGQAFVNWMATPQAQLVYTTAGGQIPAIANSSYKPIPMLRTIYAYYKSGKVGNFLDQDWPNPEVQVALTTYVQKLFDGSATPNDVLTAMQAAYAQK